MSIPITDTCRNCGKMLASFSQRFGCRECFERGNQYPPTLCSDCLSAHKEKRHGAQMKIWRRGNFVRLGDRHGVVVQGVPVVIVSWDDLPPDQYEMVADPEQLQAEYRYCPPWWDPIARDYRPGEELKFARANRVLKVFGL
jgi:hypothetical protein